METSRGPARWLALLGILALLWLAVDVLAPFIVAGILAYVLTPLVNWIAERSRVRRTVAALFVFFLVVVAIGGTGWFIEYRLSTEMRRLRTESPSLVEAISHRLTGGEPVSIFGQELTPRELAARINAIMAETLDRPTDALNVVRAAVELAVRTVITLIALAYLLVDGHRFGMFLFRFVPADHRDRVDKIAGDIHLALGRYLRGQLLLIVIMSAVTYACLEWWFHLPYALPIAIASGFLEIIPLIGPVMAGGIAAAVGFAHGGVAEAGWLALLYLVLRQAEDHMLMPLIVGRAVHVYPLFTIFAVLTGGHLFGVLGALLAVPFAAATKIVMDYTYPPLEPEPKRQARASWLPTRRPSVGH
ncbi:MAG: AI-2E family transporter [Chloroflexi bacterium]|nr:AI-2E family transporter [Chloroflexota bacterium]